MGLPSRRHMRALGRAVPLFAVLAAAALTSAQPGVRRDVVTILQREGRQTLAIREVDGQPMVALDELASLFDLQVKDDTLAGGLTITRGGRTLIVSTQGLVSSGGRLISLPPPVRAGRTWLVPIDFVGRALPLLLEVRAEYRRSSRLLVIGDLRVPRVTVRTEALGSNARVTIDISPATEHRVVQQSGRLLLTLGADALDADLAPPPPGETLAAVGTTDDPPAVALELGPRFASFRASDVPVDAGSARVVIDLVATGQALSTGAGPAGAPSPPGGPPPPDVPAPVFDGPVTGLRTIVIDPGHGGEETGARGAKGTLEKDVTLAVARQLKATIEARLGLRVLLTREGDETVPLDARAALANNNKADVFVSLHANASVSPAPSGAEVFYLALEDYGQSAGGPHSMPSTRLPVVGGGERTIDLILWEMAQARHVEDSAVLAGLIEAELRARVPMSPRAIQQAPFRVLVGANMPAVLVELGFLTNAEEETKLASREHQALLVEALYESLVRFRAFLESGRRLPGIPPAAGGR